MTLIKEGKQVDASDSTADKSGVKMFCNYDGAKNINKILLLIHYGECIKKAKEILMLCLVGGGEP